MDKDTKCIIYYNGASWNDTPARQVYLMAAMARYIPVIFLDSRWETYRKITFARPVKNLVVVHGLISIFVSLKRHGCEFLLPILAPLLSSLVLKEVVRPYKKVIFWNAENWMRPHRFIRHDALIFDCIDPVFSKDPADIAIYDKREAEMLRNATRVFASAGSLYDHCRAANEHVTLLKNACEPSDYESSLIEKTPRPKWWPKTDLPIVAYLGSLDMRFDFDCVELSVRSHPELHFILAGNVVPDYADRVSALAAMPNVTCPGRISVEDGRYLLSRCAIGLIPFTPGEMNDAVNPVKMFAYALLGKPMVGMATRELREYPDVVFVAETAAEFSSAIDLAMERARDRVATAKLKAFALENTWEVRARQAWEVVRSIPL